jgi:hypothetical protein
LDLDDLGLPLISLSKFFPKLEKLEVDTSSEESSALLRTGTAVFIDSTVNTSSGTLPKNSNFYTIEIGREIPVKAGAIIAERINSSKALIEGSLNRLLYLKSNERINEFNALINIREPELLISVGLELFNRGKGERVLSYASSAVSYAETARAYSAYTEAFSSQFRGIELLFSSFLNLNISAEQKVVALLPVTSTQKPTVAKVLIEELQGVSSLISRPLLEQLTTSRSTDVSNLAKETLQEIK